MARDVKLDIHQSSYAVVCAVIAHQACLLPDRPGTIEDPYHESGPCQRLDRHIRGMLEVATIGADVYVRDN